MTGQDQTGTPPKVGCKRWRRSDTPATTCAVITNRYPRQGGEGALSEQRGRYPCHSDKRFFASLRMTGQDQTAPLSKQAVGGGEGATHLPGPATRLLSFKAGGLVRLLISSTGATTQPVALEMLVLALVGQDCVEEERSEIRGWQQAANRVWEPFQCGQARRMRPRIGPRRCP